MDDACGLFFDAKENWMWIGCRKNVAEGRILSGCEEAGDGQLFGHSSRPSGFLSLLFDWIVDFVMTRVKVFLSFFFSSSNSSSTREKPQRNE